MTFKIDQSRKHNSGFDISIGTGKIFYARTGQEIVHALEHFFGKTIIPENPYDWQKHKDHSKKCDCCPLCRST